MSKKTNEITISIETSTMLKGLVLIGVFITFLKTLDALAHPLIIISIAFFLSLALNPSVSYFAKKLKSNSRFKATAITFVLLFTFLIAFFSLILPPLASQTVNFIQDVPETIRNYKNQNSSLSQVVYKYNLEKELENFAADFGSRFGDVSRPALSTATTIGSTIISTITVLVLAFMMLVEGPKWLDRFWATQPASKRKERQKTASRMYRVVTGYVNGQVLIAGIGAAFAFIALVILSQVFNVAINAIALAGIVGLFALLPLIGTTIGAVIVVLATLFVSVPLSISIGIYFVVYQQIENVTIQPYVQSRTNNLTPLIVLTAALLGVSLGGIMGALFAIPVAGCIQILLEQKYHARLNSANSR